ncbi:hypothetical protein [Leptolyngbya sp. FACHB-261]|uniref:hypothetical protein n=1 Tax=Leptolyngbya sp. FACHB-261 TaxID=2692806 RepID=UPI001686E93F|nr:hypothetical protein [Leptolyngbya sp. FACHB-261]MBD2102303.1 hypothetical protein [Leptolyngbya sp. FACHB-261]
MNYPIPSSPEEIVALRQRPVDEDLIAAAILGVIRVARAQGQSLPDVMAELRRDDQLLDPDLRRWLCGVVEQTWTLV